MYEEQAQDGDRFDGIHGDQQRPPANAVD